jgi:hypothetical protein
MKKYKTIADITATGLIAIPAAAAPAVEMKAEELAEADVDDVFELEELVVLLTSVVVVPFFVVDVVTLELLVLVAFDKTILV